MITFSAVAEGGFQLRCEQYFAKAKEELFPFFADASNLERITPPTLRFSIVTPLPIEMAEGTLIEYALSLYRVPMRWRSEISRWNPPHAFVDEQRKGPYRYWHHLHAFEPVPGGTKMTDLVHYDHLGGSIIHSLFIKPNLTHIFSYRQERLRELFPELLNA